MSSRTRTVAHRQFEVQLAQLAFGSPHGSERAGLVEHVSSCAGCRAHLRDIETVADTLLLLAPEAEVPVGFEQRVLDMIHARCPGGPL
jgi:hypothetical protein